MAEMISKFEVVGNLIALENEYQFHKEEWDAQTLYRKICELEIAIGKRSAVEVVHCKECKHRYFNEYMEEYCCEAWGDGYDTVCTDDDYCSYGEKRDET